MEEGYLSIPGWPKYRISRDGTAVQHLRHGSWRTMNESERHGYTMFTADGGRMYFRGPKLHYCAFTGLDPRQIDGKRFRVAYDGPTPKLYDLTGLAALCTRRKTENRTPDKVANDYAEAADFCAAVLEAYRVGDYSKVIDQLTAHEQAVKAYCRSRGWAMTANRLAELWAQTFATTLQGIRERRLCVVNPCGYLKTTAKSIALKEIELRKKLRSMDQNPRLGATL